MRLINQKEWEERKKLNKLLPFVTTKSHDIHHLARNIMLLKALFSIWFSSNTAETEGITFQLSIYFTLFFNPINVSQDWNVNNVRMWYHGKKIEMGGIVNPVFIQLLNFYYNFWCFPLKVLLKLNFISNEYTSKS